MSAPATTPASTAQSGATYNTSRLFWISCLALCMAGIANALRTDIAADIESVFLTPIDPLRSGAMVGTILGVPFLAFAITIALSSPLLDVVGMKWLLPLAAFLIPSGMLVLGFAGEFTSGDNVYWVLWSGALLAGIGWGLVETVMNPLIAALYPTEKTAKLNAGHAWWPAGLVIGGLLGYFMTEWGFDWRLKLVVLILPGLGVLAMSMGLKYPPTERKAAGVSAGRMFRELANPMFVILFLSMFLTAAAELAPGAWVDFALSRTVGMPGILLLVYVSGLMFVMRNFAGPLVHRLSPIGVLWFSCLGAALGLLALSYANSPVTGLLAATLWGTGVCYLWPTMLATTSERFPHGGALLMGLMGTAGMLSIQFVLPYMASIYDAKKIELAGGEAAFNAMPQGPTMDSILGVAAQTSFRAVAILPAILLIVFAGIWLYDRSKGGYKPTKI